jgi:hypothetical protein
LEELFLNKAYPFKLPVNLVNLKDCFVSAEAPVEHKEIVKAEKPEDTKSEASNESKASISTPVTEKSKLAPPPSKRSR